MKNHTRIYEKTKKFQLQKGNILRSCEKNSEEYLNKTIIFSQNFIRIAADFWKEIAR